MNEAQAKVVAVRLREAENGVDYTPKNGATCPWCGRHRLPVLCTRPWDGSIRVRYHRCPNKNCLLHMLGKRVKSIQEDKQSDK